MKEKKEIKKIAFYIGDLGRGGAEHVIRNLAEYFYSQGVETYMVTKLKDDDEYDLSEGITRIIADITPEEEGGRIHNLFARIRKLRRIWSDIKPDIIVSFIRKNNIMALASASPLRIPVVVSIRSAPERELAGKAVKAVSMALFRRAAGIVVLTSTAKDFFPENLRKKTVIMPNAVGSEFIDLARSQKARYGIVDEEGIDCPAEEIMYNGKLHEVITVGRIDDNKNQKMLVDAFSKAAVSHTDWTLHIYGDGDGRMDLVEHVIGLEREQIYRPGQKDENGNYVNISDRIIFHGVTDRVADIMSERSIFVLPSKMEGMPNALIEAMVMGMACISTDCPCGGPRDLIDDGINGMLVPVDDTEAMAEKLDLLMGDEELRRKLGSKASLLSYRFNPKAVCRQWKDYLTELI